MAMAVVTLSRRKKTCIRQLWPEQLGGRRLKHLMHADECHWISGSTCSAGLAFDDFEVTGGLDLHRPIIIQQLETHALSVAFRVS